MIMSGEYRESICSGRRVEESAEDKEDKGEGLSLNTDYDLTQ